jgi:hypothetical protein
VLAEDMQGIRPGIAYGLGIMWIPNRCGGYWAHFGDMPGVSTLTGGAMIAFAEVVDDRLMYVRRPGDRSDADQPIDGGHRHGVVEQRRG